MKKIIVLGLDGATWKVIDPLIKSGNLKFFKRIKEKHVWGKLRSAILPLTATAWPSLFTGKNPGKHGVFDFCEIKEYQIKHYVCSNDIKAKFLWEYLEKNGIKCGIINIPLSSPFRSKISFGEGDHLRKDWMNFSWPKDTTAGLNSRNPLFNKRLLELIDLRFEQLGHILKKKEFDFLAMNIYVNDPVLHYRWNNKQFIKTALKKIDKSLAEFVQKLDKNTTLIIVSDHGMVKLKKNFYIHNWLERVGYLKLKKTVKTNFLTKIGINSTNYEKFMNPIISFFIKFKIMRFISKDIRNKYRFAISSIIHHKKELKINQLKKTIDWKNTQAFGIGVQGRVMLNLQGREKNGVVRKKDYQKVRDKIIIDLREFCKRNNLKIEIYKKEEIYKGPYINKAPDFVYIIEEGAVKANSNYFLSNDVFSDIDNNNIQADHHVDGIFAAIGKDIRSKKRIDVNILDITPTVLALFGLPIPEDMDGCVLKDIFKKELLIKKERVKLKEKELIRKGIKDLSL